jgi:four helix bundle protein
LRDFQNLQVWQKAHKLTLAVYKVTATFPKEELYGLTSQMRRAASSIPANIAEGCGRESKAELTRFLQISAGSASELQYHLLLARDLGHLTSTIYAQLERDGSEVKRMLYSFIQKLTADR